MKTIEQNIYRFNELSDKAKEKIKYDAMEAYPEEWLTEELEEGIAKPLLENTFPHATYEGIMYDLSYSQGSGAVIKFEYDNLSVFLKDFPFVKKYLENKITNLKDIELDDIDFSFICKCNHRAMYSNLDWHIRGFDEESENVEYELDEYFYQEIDTRSGELGCVIEDMQKEFTNQAYDVVENLFNDEEQFEDNWYFADGNFAGTGDDF